MTSTGPRSRGGAGLCSPKLGAMIGNNIGAKTVAVLGLGEAGSLIARDLLAAGISVRGWDPDPHGDLSGIPMATSLPDAVRGADIVVSVNWATAAVAAARDAVPALTAGQIFADHNTAGRPLKLEIAQVIAPTGAAFIDVAMMAPIPGLGMRVPMFLAGERAEELAEFYRSVGTPAEVVGATPGDAAARKLTRSIFYKGMSAAVCEAIDAGRAAGVEEWLRSDIIRTFVNADASTLDRILDGTQKHAGRRAHEMRDVAAMLDELGIPSTISTASAVALERINAAQGDAAHVRSR
jgi:3-hydroxyisobutyrate dehydrogenase-like beta-hydroxyacid dehydrogenase